ncbi:cell division protein ZipA [Oceanicoccus sp. KOV_DT_Chl]|uniref:cell division protein ZipA n=1 Tax=Oceanicoccus sp. KOV_DT_Chl TaxID=1904639 RepID=UPI000C7AE774|nr:cell division protein ZipA [Oceanicoccus sp. KOV_DT_Chl]
MELGVRDWMLIVGVLLILAVLIDGYRRMRNERRGRIRMALNKQFLNSAGASDDDIGTGELPAGGARIVGRRGGNEELDLEQSVPMLMESVADELTAAESVIDNANDLPDEIPDPIDVAVAAMAAKEEQPTTKDKPQDIAQLKREAETKAVSKSSRVETNPEEVVVINVIAKKEAFKGPDLLHILLACDLRFGDMNIFHRHEEKGGNGAVQFSMANSVEPGFFDLDTIEDFTTPGVCFFMSVPGPKDPIKAFECMVETAQCLVTNLNGVLLDESRSAMTNQTLEHCRQRLQEHQRRQLTHV